MGNAIMPWLIEDVDGGIRETYIPSNKNGTGKKIGVQNMFDKLNEDIANAIIDELTRIKNLPDDKLLSVKKSKNGKTKIKYLNEKDELCVVTIEFQGDLANKSTNKLKLKQGKQNG